MAMAAPNYIQDMKAKEALRGEIMAQGFRYGYRNFRELGELADIRHNTMSAHLKEPDLMRLDELRKLVRTLKLDPEVVLAALGYNRTQIRNMRKEEEDDR